MYYPSEIIRNQSTILAYQEMLPDRRMICCCDTKAWGKAIGYLNILPKDVKCCWGVISIVVSLTEIHNNKEIDFLVILGLHLPKDVPAQLSYRQLVTHNGVIVIINIGSIIMAVFLVYGASVGHERCLIAWLIFDAIALFMWSIVKISEYTESRSDPDFSLLLFNISSLLLLHSFYLWLVWVYRLELREQEELRARRFRAHQRLNNYRLLPTNNNYSSSSSAAPAHPPTTYDPAYALSRGRQQLNNTKDAMIPTGATLIFAGVI